MSITAKDKEKYCWDAFSEFCDEEGINLEDAEDFLPWWGCWTRAMDTVESILT